MSLPVNLAFQSRRDGILVKTEHHTGSSGGATLIDYRLRAPRPTIENSVLFLPKYRSYGLGRLVKLSRKLILENLEQI